MPRQAPQFGWSEIFGAALVAIPFTLQAPQFGWSEIWLVVQVGALLGTHSFSFGIISLTCLLWINGTIGTCRTIGTATCDYLVPCVPNVPENFQN